MPTEPILYAERREPGPLSIRGAGRAKVTFAIGGGPWVYTTRAAIQAAQLRLENSETGTVRLSTYWLDETDIDALMETVR